MKNKTTIDRIRCLLHKYYEAGTTPEEELLLESFFLDTPEEEIPEDLYDDRLLFLSMTDMRPTPTDLVMPEASVEKLTLIIDAPPVSTLKKQQTDWMRRIVYSGIAAAVCAIITVGVLNRPATTPNQSIGKLTEDGYIEITDPQEAERIAMEIGRLLTSNSKKTDEAISRVADAIDEYKEITKSVLK